MVPCHEGVPEQHIYLSGPAHIEVLMDTLVHDHSPKPLISMFVNTLSEETAHSTVYHHLGQQSSCITTAQRSLR